jgi:hypothetical protein
MADADPKAAPADIHFWPLKNFENKNKAGQDTHYVAGVSYRIRPGNAELAALTAEWEKKEMITFKSPHAEDAQKSRAVGVGKVS